MPVDVSQIATPAQDVEQPEPVYDRNTLAWLLKITADVRRAKLREATDGAVARAVEDVCNNIEQPIRFAMEL